MRVLGIPITPPFYYLWSLSLRQIDLLCSDCSITVYPKTDKCKGGRGGKRDIEFPKMTKASIEVARQRWEAMKRDKENRKGGGLFD